LSFRIEIGNFGPYIFIRDISGLVISRSDAITVAVKGLKDNQGSALPIEELAEKARNKVALK
jgi:hypothetical protein